MDLRLSLYGFGDNDSQAKPRTIHHLEFVLAVSPPSTYNILYYTILDYTIIYYTILYYTILRTPASS